MRKRWRYWMALLGAGCAVAQGTLAEPARFAGVALSLPTGVDPSSVTNLVLADLTGDGSTDLLVTMGAASTTGGTEIGGFDRLYLNADGGFFGPGLALDTLAASVHVGAVVADFDRDGRIDAVVAGGALNFAPQPTGILRGQPSNVAARLLPDGTLGPVVTSTAIAAADIDADGDIDVAIARANGNVDLFLNESTPGAFAFQALPSVPASSVRAGALGFGQFGGDALPDLAVLRPVGAASESAGLLVYVNSGGAVPFQSPDLLVLPQPIALSIANLDGDGFDDIVVASQAITPSDSGATSASRIVYRRPQFEVDSFRFPAVGHTAVTIRDFNLDGLRDIVLGQSPCPPQLPDCLAREASTLSVWLQTTTRWEPSPQCIGRHPGGPRALASARIGFAPLPDFVAVGAAAPAGSGGGFAQWRNGAGALSSQCCFAQTAAQYGEDTAGPASPPAPAPAAPAAPQAVAAIDLDAYAGVRDELMADATNGDRLRDRYVQFSPELVSLIRTDLTLWTDAAAVLSAWGPPIRALLDGQGSTVQVSATMIGAVDDFLDRIALAGSPALAQAIATERALLPPLAQLIGLDMVTFRERVLPRDILLVDGFE